MGGKTISKTTFIKVGDVAWVGADSKSANSVNLIDLVLHDKKFDGMGDWSRGPPIVKSSPLADRAPLARREVLGKSDAGREALGKSDAKREELTPVPAYHAIYRMLREMFNYLRAVNQYALIFSDEELYERHSAIWAAMRNVKS